MPSNSHSFCHDPLVGRILFRRSPMEEVCTEGAPNEDLQSMVDVRYSGIHPLPATPSAIPTILHQQHSSTEEKIPAFYTPPISTTQASRRSSMRPGIEQHGTAAATDRLNDPEKGREGRRSTARRSVIRVSDSIREDEIPEDDEISIRDALEILPSPSHPNNKDFPGFIPKPIHAERTLSRKGIDNFRPVPSDKKTLFLHRSATEDTQAPTPFTIHPHPKRQTVHSYLPPGRTEAGRSLQKQGSGREFHSVRGRPSKFLPYVPNSLFATSISQDTLHEGVHGYNAFDRSFMNAVYEEEEERRQRRPHSKAQHSGDGMSFDQELQEKLQQRRAHIDAAQP